MWSIGTEVSFWRRRPAAPQKRLRRCWQTAPPVRRSCSRPAAWRRCSSMALRPSGVPVICIESRQAYQALKSLATHKTDRNDARGLAHLARTGLLQARPRQVAAGPCGARPDHRPQEAGRAARHPGEPDPRPGGRVRGPAAPRAQPALHRAGHRKPVRGSQVCPAPCRGCSPPARPFWKQSWRSIATCGCWPVRPRPASG